MLRYGPAVLILLAVTALTANLRWSLASTLPWQGDEVPLLVRFTGLCGQATTEAEAAGFTPSFYSFRMGALRSLRAPRYPSTLHTSTGFWTNLTLHLFGYSPGAGRAGQFFWSLVAIVAVGWAAWMARRSVAAACAAAWMVALSPMGVAYAAQARGYAEALALTPLLLIALEYLRRKPDSWRRGLIAYWCALQLSMTIYTMWVYWVLPLLGLGILLFPRMTVDRERRRVTRAVVLVLALGLGSFMVIYTADRWRQLSYAASNFGISCNGLGQMAWFLGRLSRQLLPAPAGLALFALLGIVVLWRSSLRWWAWAAAVGAAAPLIFAFVNGSPGYVRNLIYLLAPTAILFGLGVDAALRMAARRLRSLVVTGVAAAAAVGASTWAYAGLEYRTRNILLPDWGAVTMALDREPRPVGPRWLCGCLANHWTINWYGKPREVEAFFRMPAGGSLEVVMGAQFNEHGAPSVYRVDPIRGGIRAEPLPPYLAAVAPYEVRGGVELRRWQGTKRKAEPFASWAPTAPVFIIVRLDRGLSSGHWDRFVKDEAVHASGVVTFKALFVRGGALQSMIAPAEALESILESIQARFALKSTDLQLFALTPLSPEPPAGTHADGSSSGRRGPRQAGSVELAVLGRRYNWWDSM